jgi:hypothetical protein
MARRRQRGALAAGAAGPQQNRLRGHRRRVRRAHPDHRGHPDVPVAGSEHHLWAACLWVRASARRPEPAVGRDVAEVRQRQPEGCRSARASRLERSSERQRRAADRSGQAAWSTELLEPVLACRSVPVSAQPAFVPSAMKPAAGVASESDSELRARPEAAGAELKVWASEQRAPAVPAAAEAASVHDAAGLPPEAELAPSVQPRGAAAEVPDASRAAAAALDVTAQAAAGAGAARPGAGGVRPRAAAQWDAAAELQRAAQPEAWPRAAAGPPVPLAAASVFRLGRLRRPARPARSRWALCFVHATRSLRTASR